MYQYYAKFSKKENWDKIITSPKLCFVQVFTKSKAGILCSKTVLNKTFSV